jgi:UDP-N-acetylmuramyl pentapeptide phosphotransferase/UDP-N-acetylglucosamine-1-phosphate transferase
LMKNDRQIEKSEDVVNNDFVFFVCTLLLIIIIFCLNASSLCDQIDGLIVNVCSYIYVFCGRGFKLPLVF